MDIELSPNAELTLETLRLACETIKNAAAKPLAYVRAPTTAELIATRTRVSEAVRRPLRLIRRPEPAAAPYKCCAPRAESNRSWFCNGMMRSRARTARYDGETLLEMRCGVCGRTGYSAAS